MTAIPETLKAGTTKVYFILSKIDVIPKGAFSKNPQLEIFEFTETPTTSIQEKTESSVPVEVSIRTDSDFPRCLNPMETKTLRVLDKFTPDTQQQHQILKWIKTSL